MPRSEGMAQKVATYLLGAAIAGLVGMTIQHGIAIAEIKKETITRQEYTNLMTEIAVLKAGMDGVNKSIQELNKTNQLILQRMGP